MRGFTLVEVILGGLTLVVAVVAILGAYVGQVTLTEHARNLALAIQDADRIIEQIRQNTASCGSNPLTIAWPSPSTSWDDWLQNAGGGKNIPGPTGDPNQEAAIVTCQTQVGGTPFPCNTSPAPADPVLVTVSICWRSRNRTIGDCQWTGTQFSVDATKVTNSPAMLTTWVTCRNRG